MFKTFKAGSLRIEVHPDRTAVARAVASAAAQAIRSADPGSEGTQGVIFATGVSQLETLGLLTAMPEIPWSGVTGFHLDEYIGLDSSHKASFRRYLRQNLTGKVSMRQFLEIDGSAPDPARVCEEYARALREVEPQLCFLGVGENGHLAFNDPGVADRNDPEDVKIVTLDTISRAQQVSEGWFARIEDVPCRAITITIPPLFRVKRLLVSLPGKRKAHIARRMVEESISPACPATFLRQHPDATAYLDEDAASELSL